MNLKSSRHWTQNRLVTDRSGVSCFHSPGHECEAAVFTGLSVGEANGPAFDSANDFKSHPDLADSHLSDPDLLQHAVVDRNQCLLAGLVVLDRKSVV